MAIQAGHYVENGTIEEFRQVVRKALEDQQTFHWPLEFPEVFQKRGGFDAFVCNPPFMGGSKITGILGRAFRDYLVERLANGKRGNADLCAFFFLRAHQLLRRDGHFGMLATNTIAQGDTRDVGLGQLTLLGCSIPRAVQSRQWPGVASVEVAHVWLRRGDWLSDAILDDQSVNGISPFLTEAGLLSGNPHRLAANIGQSFSGNKVYGEGFVLQPDEAQLLIQRDQHNRDVLFPYLSGEDLNSRSDQSASRWVINFFERPLEEAARYADCFDIVTRLVKPYRQTVKREHTRKNWWLHEHPRPELYEAIAPLGQVLVKSEVGNMVSFAFVNKNCVFSHMVVVLALSDFDGFSTLQSTIHEAWARQFGSSMRTDLRYTASDCFETFPFPNNMRSLAPIGERYHDHRRQIMLARREGLTKTYNRFHDPQETSADIKKLRQLQVEMDQAVAVAYGWPDLDLGHGFHQTKQGVRCTISEAARRKVLGRLLTLNHERYAEEVAKGLHEKKKGTKAGPRKKSATISKVAGASLFHEDEP
jgi:hypothetical protein